MAFVTELIVSDEDMSTFGGTASVVISGGQFLVAGSNTLSSTIGSITKTFNYTKLDLSPGGSNNTRPVGYALQTTGSGFTAAYLRRGVIICPAGGVVNAGDLLQVQGETTFRAVVTSVTSSGTIGIALNTAASGAGVICQLSL